MQFNENLEIDRESWIALRRERNQPGEEQLPVIDPDVSIELSGRRFDLFQEEEKWGVAVRGEEDDVHRLVCEATYDAIFHVRGEWFAAKDCEEWYLLKRGRRIFQTPFSRLEDLLDFLQQLHHRDASRYAESRKAVRPGEVVFWAPELDLAMFRDDAAYVVARINNKFLGEGAVIPVSDARFDSEEYTLIPANTPNGESALIGKNGDHWSVICISAVVGHSHFCDAESLEEARQAWFNRHQGWSLMEELERCDPPAALNANVNWRDEGF